MVLAVLVFLLQPSFAGSHYTRKEGHLRWFFLTKWQDYYQLWDQEKRKIERNREERRRQEGPAEVSTPATAGNQTRTLRNPFLTCQHVMYNVYYTVSAFIV